MDPNTLSNLDPKLRETYERVMGTPTPAASTTPQASPIPEPSAQEPVTPIVPPAPVEPAAPVAETPLPPEPTEELQSQPLPNPTPMIPLGTNHGHTGLLRVLYVLGAVVFFTIYVYFWAIIFNIQLPF